MPWNPLLGSSGRFWTSSLASKQVEREGAVKKNTEAAPQFQGHGHFVLSVDVIKAHSLVVMCA